MYIQLFSIIVKKIIFPHLGNIVKNWITTDTWICFFSFFFFLAKTSSPIYLTENMKDLLLGFQFYYIALYMLILMPISYYFDCYFFVVSFEIRECESSYFISFYFFQNSLVILGPLQFHEFQNQFFKYYEGVFLIGTALNIQINLESIVI